MKEAIAYDPVTKRYKQKLIPSAIIVWWAFILLGWVLVATGLGMAFPTQLSFIYIITDPIGMFWIGVGGYAYLLALHRLATTFLLILVFAHIYTTFIYKLVRSSIFGYREEPVG